jgi:hypothetical protein
MHSQLLITRGKWRAKKIAGGSNELREGARKLRLAEARKLSLRIAEQLQPATSRLLDHPMRDSIFSGR